MKIRPVKHEGMFKNRYCGPAAISIISGISTGEAAKLLRYITGARAIRGVWTWDLEIALNDLGYELLSTTVHATMASRVGARRSLGG